MGFPKPLWGIAIIMISPHPDDFLVVRGLSDTVQNPLVRWLQGCVRVVDDIPVKNKLMALRNTCEKTLEVLA